MSESGRSGWLTHMRQMLRRSRRSGSAAQLVVDGLKVHLHGPSAFSTNWASTYMRPLSGSRSSAHDTTYTVSYVESDEIVARAVDDSAGWEPISARAHGRKHAVRHGRPEQSCAAYVDAHDGVVWASDLAQNELSVVVSSRTKYPGLEYSSTARQLVRSYLESHGWTVFHAGAVDTPDGVVMVMGDAGAGKTSLVLALLCGGAVFISNERLFVRATTGGFQVLSYPMAVAVGLGTAAQFPQLAPLIDRPDALRYPRRRFDERLVARTPPNERHHLDDKLQLLPDELTEFLAAPTASAGGELRALVVPRMTWEPSTLHIDELDGSQVLPTISRNHIGSRSDRGQAVWIETDPGAGTTAWNERSLARLGTVPAFTMAFGLSIDTVDTTRDYLDELLERLR